MSEKDIDMEKLWQGVDEKVKEGDINLSLWEAIDKAVPLALDEGRLALGFEPKNMTYAGNLRSGPNQALIQAAVEDLIGQRPEIVIIEGTTTEAWENYKQRREDSEREATEAHRIELEHEESQSAWQALNKEIRRLWENTERRDQPLQTARFLVKAIPKISKEAQRLAEEDPEAEDLHEKQTNRLFDRMSGYTGIPAALIALEYLRYQGSRKEE